jgi:DNA polymerase-3 subunit beta
MPILQNIKFLTQQNKLLLLGTDLEVGIQYQMDTEVKEQGSILLPAHRLGTILRETADPKITIDTDGNAAEIKTKDSHFRIMGADPVDYPDFPRFDTAHATILEVAGLKEMIRKTIFATAMETTRYALTGLLLEIKKKEIRLVGSDGKRLAYIKKKTEQNVNQDIKVIVPAKGMTLLERITEGKEKQTLQLVVEETQVKFIIAPNIFAFSRLIEGSFPDYEKVIPADCDKKVELKTADFYSALRRVALVTTEKFRATKLMFKDNKLTLFSRTQDVGEAQIEMTLAAKQPVFEIVFNPDFFMDILRIIGETENIILELKDKTSPAVVRIGRDYVYLIMPLSIDI